MKYKIYLFSILGFIGIYITYCWVLSNNRYFEVPFLYTMDASCPKKMVYKTNSQGQLGNQMMDYATVYVAARELEGFVALLDNSQIYMAKHFSQIELLDISKTCRLIKNLQNAMDYNTGATFKELSYASANTTTIQKFATDHQDVVFSMYDWLPNLYPKYIEELKKEFTFHEVILDEAKETFTYLTTLYGGAKKPLLYIGVHIRRGDYENHLRVLYNISLLDPSFYTTGMEYFRKKYNPINEVIFIAVSNDIPWVRQNIKFPNLHFASKSPSADMALLGLCNHTITDYGTFGFWPSLFHGGEHYTTNAYEDFIVDMMYRVKGWTVINITTPLVSENHPKGWLNRTVSKS